jgi:hypothetical protein
VPVLDAVPDSWPLEKGPLVVRNAAAHWPIGRDIASGRFVAEHGGVLLETRRTRDTAVWQVPLREYLDYCADLVADLVADPVTESDPWYAKQWTVCGQLEGFTGERLPGLFESWFDQLPERARLRWDWVFIGPPGSRSRLHVDAMCSSAWNALITGRKRWRLLSPAATVACGLLEPELLDVVPDQREYEFTVVQEPGDLLFVPSLWGHEVVNLESTIAVTGNFVNESNVRAVRRFLELTGRTTWLSVLAELDARTRTAG